MVSLTNSIKRVRKNNTSSIQSLPENRRENTFQFIFWNTSQIMFMTLALSCYKNQRYDKKRRWKIDFLIEHRQKVDNRY